jgi:hypothetical protein
METLETHLTPLLDAFYASDPPLPISLTTPRSPPELNPRILTTTDYDELLGPLSQTQDMSFETIHFTEPLQ